MSEYQHSERSLYDEAEDRRLDRSSSFGGSSVSTTQSYCGSRIIGKETLEPRGRFTLYKIHMDNGVQSWTIYRRYTDFILLNKKLRRQFANIKLSLPGRRYFLDNFDPDFINRRQKGLEEFMTNVLYHRDVAQSVPVQQFFRINRPPEPHETLEASQSYCKSLESSLASYRQALKDKDADIRSLKTELARAEYFQSEGQGLKNHHEEHISRIEETTKELQRQLLEAQQEAVVAKQELQNLKDEMAAEKAAITAANQTERQRGDISFREHLSNFRAEQDDVDQRLGQLLAAFSELPNISVNFAGRNFEVKADEGIGEHARNLRQGLADARTRLENLHQQGLQNCQREIQSIKANLAGAEFQVQARTKEAESLRRDLEKLQEKYRTDVLVRDNYIAELQSQFSQLQTYTTSVEEKYFYSLVLGVKLNMAVCGHRIANINKLQPGVLFEHVRENALHVENWPSWVSRELGTAMSNESSPD